MENFDKIARLARVMRANMETATRTNGDEFWRRKESAPDWMKEVCITAHGAMFPDDTRYALIVEALDALDECEGDESEARDRYQPEHTYFGLAQWLGSHAERFGYCDELVSELGETFSSVSDWLQAGMAAEFSDVVSLLAEALNDLEEDDDDEEPAEPEADHG